MNYLEYSRGQIFNIMLCGLDGIVKYMRSQVGPASKELKSASDFESFIAKDDVAIIGI